MVVLLALLPVLSVAALPTLSAQPIHYAPSGVIPQTTEDPRVNSSSAPTKQSHSSSTGSVINVYYVGAQAPTEICSPACIDLVNSGARTTIQVLSQQVKGCLSYWISDDSGANIWGQVGYYICDGSTPVAFYQVWDLNTYSVLETSSSNISDGYHQFSMYFSSGTTWEYAVDGKVFGAYDMRSNVSMPSHPVQALSEEGYVSAPWTPARVTFSSAIQILNSGEWSSAQTLSAYSGGCNSDGAVGGAGTSDSSLCWGAQGNLQNSTLAAEAVVVGGSTPTILSGSPLGDDVSASSSAPSVTP